MKTTSKILLSTLFTGATAITSALGGIVYIDDVDAGGPWIDAGTSSSFTTVAGLAAQAGTSYYYGSTTNSRGQNVYDLQLGSLTVQEGTYTVTFDVGTDSTFATDASGFLTGNGTQDALEVLDATNVSITSSITPTPSSGWETWTIVYDVAEGASVIDQALGFKMSGSTDSPNFTALAFDNFSLDFVGTAIPEPSSFALLAGCFSFLWVMVRRRG